MVKKYICPKCNKKEGLKVNYGHASEFTLMISQKKDNEPEGHIIGALYPNRKCMKCNHFWKTNE